MILAWKISELLELVMEHNEENHDQFTEFRYYDYMGNSRVYIGNGISVTQPDGIFEVIDIEKVSEGVLDEIYENLAETFENHTNRKKDMSYPEGMQELLNGHHMIVRFDNSDEKLYLDLNSISKLEGVKLNETTWQRA